ncbi:Ankyrin repeat and KH domain-containing protein 1, variant 2 [Trebouxia sp. C0009 RCD-2024]
MSFAQARCALASRTLVPVDAYQRVVCLFPAGWAATGTLSETQPWWQTGRSGASFEDCPRVALEPAALPEALENLGRSRTQDQTSATMVVAPRNSISRAAGVADQVQPGLLCVAASCGHAKDVKALLSAGANVDGRDATGRTALIRACFDGHLEVAEVLLRAGADVNASDKWVSLQQWHNSSGISSLQHQAICEAQCSFLAELSPGLL